MVPDPLSGLRPLGDGVGSGYLETEVPQFGPGAKKALVWGLVPPRSQLFVKMGARAPVPYGVGATVSDILI